MGVGINITDKISVCIGDIKEKFLKDLTDAHIEYTIPFDKTNKNGVKETIIHMKEIEAEISMHNDIITFIKTASSEHSEVAQIGKSDFNAIQIIKDVQNNFSRFIIDDKYTTKIEKLDTVNFNITLIVYNDNEKLRVQIVRDNYGRLYVQTIKSI